MPAILTEQDVENSVLKLLKELGYTVLYGPDISEGGINEERKYSEVVLVQRLRNALRNINKYLPQEAIEEAIKKVLRTDSPNPIINNQNFHKMLTNGVDIEYKKNNEIKNDKVWLIDFDNKNNEFLAVNQFTVKEERNTRRPDIILFINGLPLVVIELKNPADENATLETAFNQFQTYKSEISSLFRFNEILITSDGLEARAGTISSNFERFVPWKTVLGKQIMKNAPQLRVMAEGMLNKSVLLDLIHHFIVFWQDKGVTKMLAAYHQYHAANKAVQSTINAITSDKRAGVVWHTQGSGKSLTMVFYTGKLILQKELKNPTIILLTDRNDLDDQLFDTFGKCHELVHKPKQANSREEIKELLQVSSGGVIFTTVHKFFPEIKGTKYPLLSDRKNIIVIADEAHRSQYDFIDGFARHMRDALPNASFIGFTGTPIEHADKSTPAVFGKYVDIYDIEQAIDDGTTVTIYYESRLAKLDLKPEEIPKIDKDFEEATEGEETAHKEKLKSKWARLEKIVGSPNRIKRIAKDLIKHWEERLSVLDGKAMVVCMSRRICVELHNELVKLRPEWYSKDDNKGMIKVIMTGSASDPLDWQEHIRTKTRRKDIGERMKNPEDPLKIVIVRDMWLTGFDVPCLHTMYIDKPMQGHNLMQAIARVNRVFKNKKGGLVVDYIGIADDLKKALADYTQTGAKGKPAFQQEDAVAVMLEQYEIIRGMLHGWDYSKFFSLSIDSRLEFMKSTADFILQQKDGKERFAVFVKKLLEAFALSVPNKKALKIKDEVGFFQAVKATIVKASSGSEKEKSNLDSAIKQILSKAIISDRVIDVFAAAGMKKPNIAILSDEFLEEIKDMPQKNLALEMLKKLIQDEIKLKQKKNIVQARSFSEMLEQAIKAYTNKNVETAEVIKKLIELAKKMKESADLAKKMKLSEEELAFYDALADHKGVKEIMGDKQLKIISQELIKGIKNSMTIDWKLRDNVQAEMRVRIRKILKKYGYPPDKQQKATETVIEQARVFCDGWEDE